MLDRRAVACLLTIIALLLGVSFHVAPYSAGMDHGTELAITRGMPGGSGECDRGQLPTTVGCQVSCMGIAAAFVTVPVLPLPRRATGWFPTSDVRGSGRELAPDLPPPKSGGVV